MYGFVDVSIKVYCVVVYFVCEVYGVVYVILLIFKIRVVLLKKLIIFRLELMLGRILVRFMDMVKNVFKEEVYIIGMC